MTNDPVAVLRQQVVDEVSAVVLKELHAMEERIITSIIRMRLGDPS